MGHDISDILSLESSSTSSNSIDYYKDARNLFLARKFPCYPNLTIKAFELSFSINSSAKNAHLIYTILDTIPQKYYSVQKNEVLLIIYTENELLNWITHVSDIIVIVKSWQSVKLQVNDVEISLTTEFGYLMDFLYEKHNLKNVYLRRSVKEIRAAYSTHRKIVAEAKIEIQTVSISRDNVEKALKTVIDKYVEIYGHNKIIEYFEVSQFDRVVMFEESLIINFKILPKYWAREYDEFSIDWEYPYIIIQELTHNDLHKTNFAEFKRYFHCNDIGIEFYPFHGLHYYRKEIDSFDEVDRKLPNLKLQERCAAFPGELHHFIILRIENIEGNAVYGVGDTKGKVHTFILKLCKELEEKNSRSLELNGASCLPFSENKEFVAAFLSWKGKKKRWSLENKFSYFYDDRQVKNDLDLFGIPTEIITAARNGVYDNCEFGSYKKPLNRWKSEEQVYNIVRKLYKDYQVIYQYKPFYLRTERGNMSYDVYICGLKIAIEYQGEQHFKPVEYFGGKENFKKQCERDQIKATKSKENGIKLIYVNYWEDITTDLIRKKIEEAIL